MSPESPARPARRAATKARVADIALCVQREHDSPAVPDEAFFARCAAAALTGLRARAELTVRVVDDAESRALNARWRGIDKPTNVLSFPTEGLAEVAPDLLGDIVICAPQVAREAAAADLAPLAHWAHLTVHGVLHLLGFDHEDDDEAEAMEEKERVVLAGLGYADPYRAA